MRTAEHVMGSLIVLVAFVACVVARAEWPEEAAGFVVPEKWAYTSSPADLPIPRAIVYAPLTLERLEITAREWARNGFAGVIVQGIMPQWHSDVWAADGDPGTMGEADATFRAARRMNAVCRKAGVDANFLSVAWSGTLPDWFDDVAWGKINSNFYQAALFARGSGFRGLAIDTEYTGAQYQLDWPGYSYQGYTPEDLVAKIAQRMRLLMAAVYDAWPEIEIAQLPGTVDIITAPWFEEAARRDAPGGIHLFSEGTYIRPNPRYVFAHTWNLLNNARARLTNGAWEYFRRRCSIAPGAWPIGDDQMPYLHRDEKTNYPPDEFRAQWAALQMVAPRYVWIYTHGETWWGLTPAEQELYTGRAVLNPRVPPNLEEYRSVVRERRILDDPGMLSIARELRGGVLRDHARELGWATRYRLEAPHDKIGQTLWPYDLLLKSPMYALQAQFQEMERQQFKGVFPDAQALFGTITQWNIIGPFDNPPGHAGMSTVYPPEREIRFDAFYATSRGWVRWFRYESPESVANVNLKSVLQPSDYMVAYALGYLTVARDTPCQIRLSGNDRIAAWLGGRKIHEKSYDGVAILDEAAVDVVLPRGTTPLLLKVGNAERGWEFYCRVTDRGGRRLRNVSWSLRPPR